MNLIKGSDGVSISMTIIVAPLLAREIMLSMHETDQLHLMLDSQTAEIRFAQLKEGNL